MFPFLLPQPVLSVLVPCVKVPGSKWAACKISWHLVSSSAGALPLLCLRQMDELEVPALLAQFRGDALWSKPCGCCRVHRCHSSCEVAS